MDLMAKMGQLTRKHGIKVVGEWASLPDHFLVVVYEAPNTEAMIEFSMKPEAMSWRGYRTTEFRPVTIIEETMKLMK